MWRIRSAAALPIWQRHGLAVRPVQWFGSRTKCPRTTSVREDEVQSDDVFIDDLLSASNGKNLDELDDFFGRLQDGQEVDGSEKPVNKGDESELQQMLDQGIQFRENVYHDIRIRERNSRRSRVKEKGLRSKRADALKMEKDRKNRISYGGSSVAAGSSSARLGRKEMQDAAKRLGLLSKSDGGFSDLIAEGEVSPFSASESMRHPPKKEITYVRPEDVKGMYRGGGIGMNQRQIRMSEMIRRTLEEILASDELRDPRLRSGRLSISGVRVTADWSSAVVFWTMNDAMMSGVRVRNPAALQRIRSQLAGQTAIALSAATGKLTALLSKQCSYLKRTPKLNFQFDTSVEIADRLLHTMDDVAEEMRESESVVDVEEDEDRDFRRM